MTELAKTRDPSRRDRRGAAWSWRTVQRIWLVGRSSTITPRARRRSANAGAGDAGPADYGGVRCQRRLARWQRCRRSRLVGGPAAGRLW